jgi:hypothetical protein
LDAKDEDEHPTSGATGLPTNPVPGKSYRYRFRLLILTFHIRQSRLFVGASRNPLPAYNFLKESLCHRTILFTITGGKKDAY